MFLKQPLICLPGRGAVAGAAKLRVEVRKLTIRLSIGVIEAGRGLELSDGRFRATRSQ
jgi:hypothetical protein